MLVCDHKNVDVSAQQIVAFVSSLAHCMAAALHHSAATLIRLPGTDYAMRISQSVLISFVVADARLLWLNAQNLCHTVILPKHRSSH